jgi:sortase A
VWSAAVIVRGAYYNRMPVPSEPARSAHSAPDRKSADPPKRGAWLARLEGPSVGLATTVLEGSDDGTLSRAAGHLEETALPGDGAGNVAVAGHRDSFFRPLRGIRVGDDLTLTTRAEVLHYRVSATHIVEPSDTSVLASSERPTLTLVTCYPFQYIGHAPKRFIVQASLVRRGRRTPGAARSTESAHP